MTTAMCGITGFLESGPTEPRLAVLRRMTRSLRHRGPDDEGLHVDVFAALGSRRLSVIDLEHGHQPMAGGRDSVHVVQNGEIYNFRELRAELIALGHTFRTESDTEVIAHAYEQFGDACASRLEGMFAFAVWDAVQQTLLLARDRMGEKPLYYYATPTTFVFGSEPRSLSGLRIRADAVRDAVRHRQAPPRMSSDRAARRQAARGALLGSLARA